MNNWIGVGDPLEEKIDAVNQAIGFLSKVRQPIDAIITKIQREKIAEIEQQWTNQAYKG